MVLKQSKTIEETIKNFCDEYKIIERSFETCWLNDGFKVYEYLQYNSVQLRGLEMNLHYHPHVLHDLHLEQSYSFLKRGDDRIFP